MTDEQYNAIFGSQIAAMPPILPSVDSKMTDEQYNAIFGSNAAKPKNNMDEPVDYADEPADYADEPADYADEPADYADEPVDYADEPADYADEPADAADEPADYADEPANAADEPADYADEPAAAAELPAVDEAANEEPAVAAELPAADEAVDDADEPADKTNEPATDADEPTADADEPADKTNEPAADADEPTADADEPAADADEPTADADEPTADVDEPAAAAPATAYEAQDDARKTADDADKPANDGEEATDDGDEPKKKSSTIAVPKTKRRTPAIRPQVVKRQKNLCADCTKPLGSKFRVETRNGLERALARCWFCYTAKVRREKQQMIDSGLKSGNLTIGKIHRQLKQRQTEKDEVLPDHNNLRKSIVPLLVQTAKLRQFEARYLANSTNVATETNVVEALRRIEMTTAVADINVDDIEIFRKTLKSMKRSAAIRIRWTMFLDILCIVAAFNRIAKILGISAIPNRKRSAAKSQSNVSKAADDAEPAVET
jgi:hypothetical protein